MCRRRCRGTARFLYLWSLYPPFRIAAPLRCVAAHNSPCFLCLTLTIYGSSHPRCKPQCRKEYYTAAALIAALHVLIYRHFPLVTCTRQDDVAELSCIIAAIK